MTSVIVDRRPQSGKSAVNRQRVLKRMHRVLKEQVDLLVGQRKLREMDGKAEVQIQRKDVSEPSFSLDQASGQSDRVMPGNDRFRVGDRVPKPKGGGAGAGQGDGEGQGEDGQDSFRFMLSREEFLGLLFDDMVLPELVRKELTEVVDTKFKRSGFVRHGNPASVSVLRTFKASLGRRIATAGSVAEDIQALETELGQARERGDAAAVQVLLEQLEAARARGRTIPFLDPVDLRHRSLVEVPVPSTAAVMFCLMDVSGSMDEERKDLAKRFFTLLYLFLKRKYEKVELVFIRHTETAEECDEQTFFYDPKSGGTQVLSVLQKMKEIIQERYPPARYNIFGAQASDGDCWGSDPAASRKFLIEELLPVTRYFTYAETYPASKGDSNLWQAYSGLDAQNFSMAPVRSRAEVYPALAQLFRKAAAEA